MKGDLWVCHLGVVGYRWAVDLQERIRTARQRDRVPDVLLLLEHEPVYTRGRRSAPGELPLGAAWYAARGIEIVDTNRGGKITYHGPGQLVGYPIVRVGDVVAYVRTLEQALVQALAEHGLPARARVEDGPAFTGVWVQDRKIASIGVHLAQSITTHGFAVNVINDLWPFSWVVACGLPEVTMTSIQVEQTAPSSEEASPRREGCCTDWSDAELALLRDARGSVERHIAAAFGLHPVHVTLDQLEKCLAAAGVSSAAGAERQPRTVSTTRR